MNQLNLETYGQGESVVLVHGWSTHSGVWGDLTARFSNDFETMCLDLPGHGKSRTVEPFDIETICSTIAAAVPNKPCWWLGWSLGASIVLALAERFPQLVRGVILLAFNPCFIANKEWPGMAPVTFDQFSQNLLHEYSQVLKRFDSLQVNGDKALLLQLRQNLAANKRPDGQVLTAGLKVLRDFDSRDAFKELGCPVTVMLGTEDQIIPAATGKALLALKPDLDLRMLPGAGHAAFLSHGPLIYQIIRELWLR